MNIDELMRQIDADMDRNAAREAELRSQAEAILDRYSDPHASLSTRDNARMDALFSDIERCRAAGRRIQMRRARAEEVQAEEREIDRGLDNAVPTPAARQSNGMYMTNAGNGQRSQPLSDQNLPLVYADNGRPAVVARDQRFADHWAVREHANRNAERDKMVMGTHGSFGQMLRSMSTGNNSAVVPSSWSHDIIDLARNKSVAFKAGASLIPMPTKIVYVPRLTQDAVPAWKTEGSAITAADAAYDNVTLTATTLAGLTVVSREFLQDAIDAETQIMHSLSAQMALTLDTAIFYGQLASGGSEPQSGAAALAAPAPMGILQNLLTNAPANVLGSATNGTVQTATKPYGEILSLLYTVKRANENPTAIVSNDAMVELYQGMTSTQNQPLNPPAVVADMPWLTTNMIANFTRGTGTNMSDVFAGDFRQVYVGQRLSMEIRTLTERYAENGQVGILAYFRGDVQLARPKSMAVYRYLQASA